MTDTNDTDDQEHSDLEDLGDSYAEDAADVWGADEDLESTGFDDLDLGLQDVDFSLGLFGDDPANVVEELLAIDELDEQHVEEVLTEYTVEELLEADIHDLMTLPTIGPNEAAALLEWIDEKDVEKPEEPAGNAEGAGSPRSSPGGETSETTEHRPGTQTADEPLDTGRESGANTSSGENAGHRDDPALEDGGTDERVVDQHPQNDPALEDDRDGDDEPASSIGESIGAAVAWPFVAIASLLGSIAFGASRFVPGRMRVYRKMIKAGYKGIYKKTGAHVVANTIYQDGEMVPRKGEVNSEEGNLETANGEWWTASSGLQPVFLGDVPIVYGVADQHELVDPIAARIAEAVELGPQRYQRVEETPQGYAPVADEPRAGAGGSAPRATADGGLAGTSTTFDDVWVDVSNPVDENDGMIVSMEKAYALHWDQGATEEMENQETRGMLSVMDPRADRKKALMYVLLFAGGIALGMFGPSLAQSIAPGGGGGGISVGLFLGVL